MSKAFRGGICKQCDNQRSRAYYERNRERMRAARNARNMELRGGPRMCANCHDRQTFTQRHHYCRDCMVVKRDERLQRRGDLPPEKLARARQLDAERSRRYKESGKYLDRYKKYDPFHRKRRERWEPTVAAGLATCGRCGLRILPGQDWDLGHNDFDPTIYNGPEHRYSRDCPKGGNRATSRHRKERE